MISGSAGGTLSPSNDKRRNKLGYQRTSVACSHCRRRKIRCLPATPEDSAGRCANCIRLRKDCTFFPVDHGTNLRAGGSTPLSSSSTSSSRGMLTPSQLGTESAQSPPLEEPATISLPPPEELPSQLATASSRSYSAGFLPAATNGLAIQPTFMISQAAEHEGWQSPPFPHTEASPYWGSGESTPNPSAFQQMPELTPTSSGPPFAAGAINYPQQWAAQGRSSSFSQLEGSMHHSFTYPSEMAPAELPSSLQFSLAQGQGVPAPHVGLTTAERASPAAMLASHGQMPPFPYQQQHPPQAWIAQAVQPGVSPWFSEPSPLTELDLNEQETDPFAGTASPVYPNRQNTS